MVDAQTKKKPSRLSRVSARSDAPHHTETTQYSGAYAALGVDNTVSLTQFRKEFKVEIIKLTKDNIEFDMIGIDPSIANAFRRIIIAELPTMGIETVLIAKKTGVEEEVLSHRLGLIPIQIDPRIFEYKSEHDTANEKNTVVFKLHASCPKQNSNDQVKSDQLKWLPNGSEFLKSNLCEESTSKPQTFTSFSCSQESLPGFPHKEAKLVPDDIIIDKLGPVSVDREIDLEANAVKGDGKTHAEWSPVGTAWYRMFPEEKLKTRRQWNLLTSVPLKVFGIEDLGADRKRTTVARPRDCTRHRECIEGAGWDELVSVKIESTGQLPPEAVKILEDKCESVLAGFSDL